MTRPGEPSRLGYVPALDGLRGVAVAAVMLFHADVAWAEGGHLGVTAFFTLSGFLITGLLLVERHRTGRIALLAFWARRARRLVPAALVSFALIAAVVALSDAPPARGLVGDAVSAATWSANWRFIVDGQTYADLFSAPSPFQHFWSLAVEEQFYVLFPLLAVGLLAAGRGRVRHAPFAAVLLVLIALSTLQAARLHDPGDAIARAYYGTDARIAEILVGALLAVLLVGPQGIRSLSGAPRRAVALGGVAGLTGLLAAFAVLGDRDAALYDGGFLAVAVCTAALIAAAVQPGSLVGRGLSNAPAVALGKVSYGAYLFHWPVFLLLGEEATGLDQGPLLVVRVGVTLCLAFVSYAVVEAPIRYGRVPAGVGLVGWANGAVAGLALVALVSGQVVPTGATELATAAPGSAAGSAAAAQSPGTGADAQDGKVSALGTGKPAPAAGTAGQQPAAPEEPASPAAPAGFFDDPAKSKVPPVPDAPEGSLRVAVVGDSIGINIGDGLAIWGAERGDVVVYNLAFPACPISRGGERRFGDGDPFPVPEECAWWDDPSSERAAALEDFDPDVVVLQDGVNEIMDRRRPEWDDYRRPGQPQFDQWLRDEYRLAFTGWGWSGAKMVVTNAPCAHWDRYERFRSIEDAELRVQALNVNVYRPLVEVTVADLFERICPAGQYSNEVEGVENGRPDGFHLSDEAAAALARNWLGPIILETAWGDDSGPLPVG